ncbi:hypothetical protein MNBD_GAMMA12-3232 [hydrothermal vent metagenome]|uniref:Cytochrome P450 n=1 Tax=hydrothermal vent metagenome TaxID=652676 RepID=A0A3B0YUD7_9ZZZZ
MDNKIPKTSFITTLLFNLCHVIPYYLSGIFTQRHRITKFFAFLGIQAFNPKYCEKLRSRYRSDYIYTRMLFSKVLLVFDVKGIQQILDKSPAVYGVADLKFRGMSYFQPNSVTLSSGHQWYDRRQFNESVLETDQKLHSLAQPFLTTIESITSKKNELDNEPVHWDYFSTLFMQLAQQTILGDSNKTNSKILARLMSLMAKANRIFLLRPSKKLAAQDHDLRARLHAAPKDSLLSLCPHVANNVNIEPEHQVPHWLFAMGDTLAANVIRTLLLICTHPAIEKKVLAQIKEAGALTAEAIDSLDLLEHCTQETMRLWPTTPMLARKMLRRDNLQGNMLMTGTSLLILNNATHRDTRYQKDAHLFNPERWKEGNSDYAYNHFSNGTQICPGKNLALFLSKAVLAQLFTQWKFQVCSPTIKEGLAIPTINHYFSIRFKVDRL